jgi:hypothetical protein
MKFGENIVLKPGHFRRFWQQAGGRIINLDAPTEVAIVGKVNDSSYTRNTVFSLPVNRYMNGMTMRGWMTIAPDSAQHNLAASYPKNIFSTKNTKVTK